MSVRGGMGLTEFQINSLRGANQPKVQTQVRPQAGVGIKPGVVGPAINQSNVNEYANVGLRGINAAVRYDDKGRPIQNQYATILDAQGRVRPAFSMSQSMSPGVQLGSQGFDQIRQNALSQGPSSWAMLQNQLQANEQSNALQNAQRSAMQGQNSAFNQLRMRGGLSAGQRERLALQSQRNLANQSQGVLNQGMNQRLNIGLQDQQRKDQFLSQLPGLELQQAQWAQGQRQYGDGMKQFDIQNALRDVSGLNAFNSNTYQQMMQEWGAKQTADAQARAANNSSPGGLLGGALIPGLL